jgi:multidrug resistance efflux pump
LVFILGVNELEIRANVAPQVEPATIRIRVDQLEPVKRTLEQHAIDFLGPQSEDSHHLVQVRDPNGNVVEFVQRLSTPTTERPVSNP